MCCQKKECLSISVFGDTNHVISLSLFKMFRFWFENPGVFSQRQRTALTSASLSKIICDNTGLTSAPLDVFSLISDTNRLTSCNNIRRVDLSAWRERPNQLGKKHWNQIFFYQRDKSQLRFPF